MTSRNRSQDLRVKATFRVGYETMDQLVVAYTTDLSRGGMFVATYKLLPRGTVIRLNIALPDGESEVSVTGKVVYVREASQSEGRSAGMGVQFIDPDGSIQRRLQWRR